MFVKGPPAEAQDDHVIVSFTFDDAWETQYPALSVFGDHDMRATFYVNTGTVGTSLHLSWAQLHQLADAGHEIGGHTVNHAALTDIDEATARAEIQGDITTLQAQGFPRRSPSPIPSATTGRTSSGTSGKRGTPPPGPPTSTRGSPTPRRTRTRCGYPAGASTAPRAWRR